VIVGGTFRPKRGLTRTQVIMLLRTVKVVEQKRGLTYIPQWEARATMLRIFGPGNWDSEVVQQELVYETQLTRGDEQFPKEGKASSYWIACYRVGTRVNIRDYWGNPVASFLEYHVEENAPLPNRGEAHAMAMTSCESYALRRALIGLGDALGLHLYDKGRTTGVVGRTAFLEDRDSPLYRPPAQGVDAPSATPESEPANGPVRVVETDEPEDDFVAQAQAGAAVAAGFNRPDAP
jgi:hypothetical protein